MRECNRSGLGLRALLVAVVVVAAAGPLARSLLATDHFEGDWCQHVAWTAKYEDPHLFPNDPHVQFFGGPPFSTLGVRALYAAAVPLLGPETTARTLGALLIAVSTLLAYVLGSRLGGRLGGVLLVVVLALHSRGFAHVVWAIPRSFALPLHLLTAWAIVTRRRGALGLSFVLAALLYPPALPPAIGAAILVGLASWRRRRSPIPVAARRLAIPAIGVALAVGVLVWAYGRADSTFGPRVDRATAHAMSEFGPDGRAEFFATSFVRFWFTGPASGVGAGVGEAVATILGCVGLMLLRPRRTQAIGIGFLVAGLVSFLSAHATLFALHLPNRYVSTIWPVAQAAWAAVLIPRGLRWLGHRVPIGGMVRASAAALLVIALASTTSRVVHALAQPIDSDRRAVHEFLATLPKDALVAAHPMDADPIPLRARRSVLASHESAQPYWLGYYGPEKERLDDSLRACYATSFADLDAFAARHHVSVFVVNAARYDDAARGRLQEPFGTLEATLVAAVRPAGFALSIPPADRVLFRRGPYAVVRVGR
jgi:hypothetical protein